MGKNTGFLEYERAIGPDREIKDRIVRSKTVSAIIVKYIRCIRVKMRPERRAHAAWTVVYRSARPVCSWDVVPRAARFPT